MILALTEGKTANISWVGSTNNSWNVSSNWSTNSIPDSADNVTISSGTYDLVLDQNRKVTNLTLSNKTIDLNGFSLTVYGVATMTSGTVTNGDFIARGSLAAFNGTLMDCSVDANCGYIRLSGSTFNEVADFTDQGVATGNGNGGCTFNDNVTITHNGTLTYFTLGYSSGDVFNADVTFINNSNREIYVASSGSTTFNGNVVLNSTSTGGILFGNLGGSAALASGKTISIGGSGFTADYLTLKNFTQTGSTAQTLTLTSTAVVNMISCTFNGNLTVSSPGILLKNSTFNGTSSFTRTASSGNHQSDGGNTFNIITLDNAGSSGRVRWATTTPDVYTGNATFSSSGGQDVQIAYSGDNLFSGNITINSNKVVFNTASGKVTFTGGSSQTLNGSYNYSFKKLALNKSANHVTANTTLSVDDTLFFVSKNLITTSTYLLTMKHGSTASGASNSSFVSGPIKKVGNSAFEFPVGKGDYVSKIAMTAPSNSTDSYTAEFINTSQSYGSTFDTTLLSINQCNYWTLARNTGASNIKVTLHWNSQSCNISFPANSRVANWSGSTWVDLGNDGYGGSLSNGFVKALNNPSSYTAFMVSNIPISNTGAPNLYHAKDFAILSGNVIQSDSLTFANGKVGSAGSIGNIVSSDSSLAYGVGSYDVASLSLDTAIMYCNGLDFTPTSNAINGQSFYEGVYSIFGDVSIDSIVNLIGDSTSVFIFNIYGSLQVDSGAFINLNGAYPQNIFWNVSKAVSCSNNYWLPGTILAKNTITITDIQNSLQALMSKDSVIFYSLGTIIGMNTFHSPNQIANENYISLGGGCSFPSDPCNLVRNSDFSINSQLPNYIMQINFACPWMDPLGGGVGTADYFHINSSTPMVDLPTNAFGCQSEPIGPDDAYAGFLGYGLPPISREYIQQPLQSTLQAGTTYYSEMYVSLADRSAISINSLGMFFSSGAISQTGYALVAGNPQIQSPNTQLNDKTGWVRVSGCFPATGNETFIVIGNFNTDLNTQVAAASANSCPTGGTNNWAYYYIDDVSTVPFEVNAGVDVIAECDGTVQLGLSTCISDLNTGQFTYSWIQLGGPLTDPLSNTSIYNPTITFNNTTGSNAIQVYQVTVTSPNGCTATDIISITVESCGTEACDEGITYCFENYTVVGSELWNLSTNPACSGNIVTIEHELRIPAGTELTINGIEVHFGPTGKIIVERGTIGSIPGGRLHVINKATLTAITDVCMWEGIQIWGYKNYYPFETAQAIAWLDRSEISYAHCGVYLGRRDDHLAPNIGGFTGGNVEEIDSCLFKDNYVGVWFPLGRPITHGSVLNIHDNNFLCEGAMRDPYYMGSRSKYFIDINHRTGIYSYDPININSGYIQKNLFNNTPASAVNSTIAIRCNSSVGIPFLNNDFIDVDRGVFFLSSNGKGQKNIVAEGNYFKRCNLGVYNLSNKFNTIHASLMEEGKPGFLGISVGILNENSEGTIIQSNSIDDFYGGIVATRSGHLNIAPFRVWDNIIDNCPFSLLAGGNNYYSTWWCNKLSNYHSGNAWTLYDVGLPGANYTARIIEQGTLGDYSASNEFNIITSPTILDIDNQTVSSIDFVYNVSSAAAPKYIPDPVSGPVIVTSSPMPTNETTFCSRLTSPFRFATEILAQRDTTRDTTLLNILNAEIYGYYVQINEIDSAIAFIDTMQMVGVDEMLLDLYFIKENEDSVIAILNRLPESNEVEYDYKRYISILHELMVDSLTLYEMDSAQLNIIAEIALGESEVAYYCKGIFNEIYSKSIDYTCEVVNACGSSRLGYEPPISKPISLVSNYPNPCSISTLIQIPQDIISFDGLKLQIYNQMGQMVANIPIFEQSAYEFYCNQLENGLYLYHFVAPNYKSRTGKMIVIRN
jgi:hypothetical protein